MIMGNEKVMLLTFELTIHGTTGSMNFYLPFGTLKPIGAVLNPHVWISGRKEKVVDPVARELAMKNLFNVDLPVEVILGEAELSMSDILGLSSGDIIQLDNRQFDPLVMQVARQKLFNVHIGKVGTNLAVQVVSAIHDPAINLQQIE